LAFVLSGRKFGDVQHFGARYMFIELILGEVDASRVDEDINRTRFCSGVVCHLAGGPFESAAPGGQSPEMIHFEARVSVVRIQGVGGRCSARRGGTEDE